MPDFFCLWDEAGMGSLKPLQNRLDQHQTILLFQAAFALLKGSLKRLRYGNGKSGYGGDTPCSVSRCAKG
ncbi:hypothetical protein [Kingella oralis]